MLIMNLHGVIVTLRFAFAMVIGGCPLVVDAWPGLNVKPLVKHKSDLAPGESGTYYQLSDNERKELVWMAKAANAAYLNVDKPLGYRSFSRAEWDAVAEGCDEIVYTEDGYFNVGNGLRGRLMVNMLNEGRVVLALSGTDFKPGKIPFSESLKDGGAALLHVLPSALGGKKTVLQYDQALKIMKGVLSAKKRSHLWIVGHSLGGSLTTYLALNLPRYRTKIKCATFNGFGVSSELRTADEDIKLAKERLRNVYCEGDPVYNNKIPIIRHFKPCHFGPSYSIKVKGNWLEQHSLDNMLKAMIKHRTKWPGL